MSSQEPKFDEIEELRNRVSRLTQEKSHLQLALNWLKELMPVSGLANTAQKAMEVLIGSIGGGSAAIVCNIGGEWRLFDSQEEERHMLQIEDPIFLQALDKHSVYDELLADTLSDEPLQFPSDSRIWCFPLMSGDDCIGALRLDGIQLGENEEVKEQVLVFTQHLALALKNEIYSLSKLKLAYEELRSANIEMRREIRERRQAEWALKNTQELLSSFVEAATEGILLLDGHERVIEVNPSILEFLEVEVEDVIQHRITEFWPQLMTHDLVREFQMIIAGGAPYAHELEVKLPSGRVVYLWFKAFKVGDGIGIILSDLSERREMEVRLRQSEKMSAIGQLAGGVAHDFNNQLAGIVGAAEIMLLKLKDQPELCVPAEIIVRSVERASGLTRQLLAFARKGKVLSRPINIEDLINEVAGMLGRSVDRRIQLERTFNCRLPIVEGDPTQLQNALLNIGINARDAMPQGGTLTFSTKDLSIGNKRSEELPAELQSGEYVVVEVSDTGTGIDDETLSHIFEPFFTTKELGKGTGMGLAAVYGTVRNHRGRITVETSPGQGTRFTVYLPKIDARAPENTQVTMGEVHRGAAHVLFVDDEEDVREVAYQHLEHLGYTVDLASNGVEAVEYYRSNWNNIDLVILDLVMPEMSGADAYRKMKRVNPELRVLIASGFSAEAPIQRLLEEGADAFIQKPFRMAELSQAVSTILGKKGGEE